MRPGQAVGELRKAARTQWLGLYVAARLAATAFAAALIVWDGLGGAELGLLLYGLLSTGAVIYLPRLRQMPVAWAVDSAAALGCVLASGDWRSPFYLLWLSTLALPAVSVPPRRAVWLALGASVAFFVVAVVGGPVWGGLEVRSAETLAIHLTLPLLLVPSLAYATDALRRLGDERAARERLAIEAERHRIAWDLHDSAKQRIHAAQLLVSSLEGRVPDAVQQTVSRATVELESAAAEMDTSLAELRSPLDGRPLEQALRDRAAELAADGSPRVLVQGTAPPLSPLAAAHVYRIGCEAITNALRHADATAIDVAIDTRDGRLRMRVHDDGRGIPAERRPGGQGLIGMQSRAATIDGQLAFATPAGGRGTAITLEVPLGDGGRLA
jgi:signal transduction histidine kinase